MVAGHAEDRPNAGVAAQPELARPPVLARAHVLVRVARGTGTHHPYSKRP